VELSTGILSTPLIASGSSQPLRRGQTALVAATRSFDDPLFALADGLQIDRNGASVDAVLSATPGQVGEAGAGDHRFGRGTARIDTDPANVAALDHRYFSACLRQGDREESAALAGPDHDGIIGGGLRHLTVLLLCKWKRCFP
jgi:hypothetical protein